jgi:hypothetical protein
MAIMDLFFPPKPVVRPGPTTKPQAAGRPARK